MPESDDLWSWLDEPDAAVDVARIDASSVTCVVVAHNGAEWIPGLLRSIERLNPAPGRIIAVDNGSSDESLELLREAEAAGTIQHVVEGDADWGFGQAVNEALDEIPEWLWLLHDDCAPRPDALGQLLNGAAQTGAAVVYPKLLQPARRNYPDALAEIGQTMTATGRRVLSVEEGDIDQHQVAPGEVLGGSTAGMLTSAAAWEKLDGLSDQLPLHRDGLDFGWRANAAGLGVTTWPDAAVMHRQSGRMNEREGALLNGPYELDRYTSMQLAAARHGTNPVRLVANSLARSAGFVLAKSPRTASAELRAMGRFLRSGKERSALAERPGGDAVVDRLLPRPLWFLSHAIESAGNAVTERYRELTGNESGTSIDELTGDDFAGTESKRTYLVSPLLLMLSLTFLIGIFAGRSLIGSSSIAGGGLLAAPGSLAGAWEAYLRPTVDIPGSNAPWLGFAAVFSTVAFGNPGWFTLLGLMFVPVLASLAAYIAQRRVGVPRGLAAGVGTAWGAAVVALGSVTAGDTTGMVVGIAGPMLASAVIRMWRDETAGAERLRTPAMAAFWMLVLACVWPVALGVGTLVGLVWIVARRTHAMDILITLAGGWLFLAPWLPTLWAFPGRALTSVDPLAWPGFFPPGLALFAGRIMPSGLPLWMNIAFFAVLGILCFIALLRLEQRRARAIIVGIIAIPMVAGAALSRLVVQVPGGMARTSLSGWALLVVAGLLVPIIVVSLQSEKGRRILGSVMALAGALVFATWAWVGFQGPVHNAPSQLPSYVADVMNSPRDTRVLMIELDEDQHLSWNLVDRRQPQWGTGERARSGTQGDEYAALVQSFSGGTPPEDLAERLAQLGIAHVWMRGFGTERLAVISNAAGLVRAEADSRTVIWSLEQPVSRYNLVAGDQIEPIMDGTVQPAEGQRYLSVAEYSDSRWEARIGDTELAFDPARPPITFDVPPGASGPLEVSLQPDWRVAVWHGLVLVALGMLAAPTLGGRVAARRSLT